jgi:hypothetical protein
VSPIVRLVPVAVGGAIVRGIDAPAASSEDVEQVIIGSESLSLCGAEAKVVVVVRRPEPEVVRGTAVPGPVIPTATLVDIGSAARSF